MYVVLYYLGHMKFRASEIIEYLNKRIFKALSLKPHDLAEA